jgi:hypothetical protein
VNGHGSADGYRRRLEGTKEGLALEQGHPTAATLF